MADESEETVVSISKMPNVGAKIEVYIFGNKKAGTVEQNCGFIEMKKMHITTNLNKINLIHFPDGQKLEQDGSDMIIKIDDREELTEDNRPIHSSYPMQYSLVIDNLNAQHPFALKSDEYERISNLMLND